MAYSKTEALAIELATPIAEKNGCYIYDAEYVKEGGLYFLRVYADRDGGIDLDMCEVISRELSTVLDEADPIKENYYLEVSSPGIERKLKTPEHFKRYIGEVVDIGLYKAVDGTKQITGRLADFCDNVISVEMPGGKTYEFTKKETTYVKLHFDF